MSFTFLAVSIFTMDPRTRTLVLGDSHIRRLHDFMSETPDAYSHNVFLDMALGERLDFHGMGGRTVQGIFDHDMEWVRWYAPHVVFLMVGGNDLTNPNLSALDVASSIHDLAKHLIDSEGSYVVFVASITGRTSYPYLNPSYPQKVGDCNQYLRVLFEAEENMFYRTLRGLYNPSTEVMLHDGIHLNDWGHYRLYRTIRGAVCNGLSMMDRLRGGLPLRY